MSGPPVAFERSILWARLSTMKMQGELVRQARRQKAWTQEELSHRSGLGLRTVRRVEAGRGSLESLRRLAEVLELEPAECLQVVPCEVEKLRDWLQCDPVRLEMSTALLLPDGDAFIKQLMTRIGKVRRHLAQEMGIAVPGVRLHDYVCREDGYRILIREVRRGEGILHPGRLMAVVGNSTAPEGVPGHDPTYGMPVVWVEPSQRQSAEESGCLVFDSLSVMMTHLTYLLRKHAALITGTEETAFLLDALGHHRLVAEVVPARISLAGLRKVLQLLLAEGVSIRDLALILEAILDQSSAEPEALVEGCRRALRDSLILPYANGTKVIEAVPLDSDKVTDQVGRACREMEERGLQAVVVTSPEARRAVRAQLPLNVAVLSQAEIPPGYTVRATGG